MAHHDHACCDNKPSQQSVCQTLDEMEFERGIWPAAMNGEMERVKELLAKGTSVDARDNTGYTALHYASRSGHSLICSLLLKSGANPNAQTSGGATPLHRAAYTNRANVVDLLLKNGADPTLVDSDGKTPLHKAAEQGHKEVSEILLKANKTLLSIRDNRNQTANDIAKTDSIKSFLEVT